ncbi:hypothetical protein DAEQUDRAFT_737435 [Daedalea quercina L-15889]|uniref:Uncharacterized protein n=1 Tax=Daedalea quercina L-15889 TaxID=1314783 RepID=A0A165RAG4_9APHY|nr:hypothetical protein DAEQUDRAFT_737435 [Daedalea quercina L-15889]
MYESRRLALGRGLRSEADEPGIRRKPPADLAKQYINRHRLLTGIDKPLTTITLATITEASRTTVVASSTDASSGIGQQIRKRQAESGDLNNNDGDSVVVGGYSWLSHTHCHHPTVIRFRDAHGGRHVRLRYPLGAPLTGAITAAAKGGTTAMVMTDRVALRMFAPVFGTGCHHGGSGTDSPSSVVLPTSTGTTHVLTSLNPSTGSSLSTRIKSRGSPSRNEWT